MNNLNAMRKYLFLSVLLLCYMQHAYTQKQSSFVPGEIWRDVDGNPINAHGGGVLYHEGIYYWYGEIKQGKTYRVSYVTSWEDCRVPAGGVSCYSSKDLLNWKYEGVALTPELADSSHDLHTSKVIERPKVIYNKHTKKFVMWMHVDTEDYSYSQSGVAVSDRPEGPYTYLGSIKPHGNMARDMTIFQDEDGKAYHFFSSDTNATMHVCLLSEDYLTHTDQDKPILVRQFREAPAVFKYEGKYFLITSACTGWSSNAAAYAVADSPLGNWVQYDNPCVGRDAEITFDAQSTFVLPIQGKPGNFIFMADRWNKTNLEDSRYLWLPLEMKGGKPRIYRKKQWR